jgi:hypothetical protein
LLVVDYPLTILIILMCVRRISLLRRRQLIAQEMVYKPVVAFTRFVIVQADLLCGSVWVTLTSSVRQNLGT